MISVNFPSFFWLIVIPLAAAPIVYLLGRFALLRGDKSLLWLPGGTALLALLACWVPFYFAALNTLSLGTLSFQVEAISLRFDGLSLLLSALVLLLSTLVVLFSGPVLRGEDGEEKYYAMLLIMSAVMVALGCSGDLFNLWVWFEAMAVSSYLLVSFHRDRSASLEAGVKYVIQSASGSVMVLIGISLVLLKTGTLDLEQIRSAADGSRILLLAGGLMVAGFGVKSALVPLHTWLPDAHTQAPSGISAMLSGVVIEAGLIAMLRSIAPLTGVAAQASSPAVWGVVLLAAGALNMLVGNLMALRQKQVKRLLAFSSVSQMGYIVFGLGVALYSGASAGAQGGMFHIFNHGLMKGLAFLSAGALLYVIEQRVQSPSATHSDSDSHTSLMISDLEGAAQRYPLVALAFSLAVLGLGGLPPLAGFMSKWQIFLAGFAARDLALSLLVVFAALNSVLSLAYYAPLVNAMYRNNASDSLKDAPSMPLAVNLPLAVLSLAVVGIGLWPSLMTWLTAPAAAAVLALFGLN